MDDVDFSKGISDEGSKHREYYLCIRSRLEVSSMPFFKMLPFIQGTKLTSKPNI